MQNWRVYTKKADFSAIETQFGIDQVVARIIRNRDVEGLENVDRYLNGTLNNLYDPEGCESYGGMKDMSKAVKIMSEAIRNGKKIRIIGDYDIDGICSIYILYKGLLSLDADVDYEIPDRIKDGYGINIKLIDEAKDDGCELIITCDNGIAANEQIAYAKSLGMTVIVTDHHDVQFEEKDGEKHFVIPPADAVVDPKQIDCKYPFMHLCGAGIAYKFIYSLFRFRGLDVETADEFIPIAAIATIGDVVELLDENRIIVKEGLKRMADFENPGLNSLMMLTGVDKQNVEEYHIGFVLGPCLNASGRLDTAKRALKLLLAENRDDADQYARELKDLNDQRKTMTDTALKSAIEVVETELYNDRILVVYLPKCHESVAGIVAGKLRERYYKPTIVLTEGTEGVKGSARSTVEYNIFEELLKCKDLLTKFGGHPMAAGLSLSNENIEPLRAVLNENCKLTAEDTVEKIWIDVPMYLEYITEKVIDDISLLKPFGKGNEKPVFADKNLVIHSVRAIGKEGQYTQLVLGKDNGFTIKAVGFFDSKELMKAYEDNKRIDCLYFPQINIYRGVKSIQINILRYRI